MSLLDLSHEQFFRCPSDGIPVMSTTSFVVSHGFFLLAVVVADSCPISKVPGTALIPGIGSPFVIRSTIWAKEDGYGACGPGSPESAPVESDSFLVFTGMPRIGSPADGWFRELAVTGGNFFAERHER